ncbi:RCC1/BLIP-II [Sparassis latifolia]
MPVTDLPVELFLDNILPLLALSDLFRLSCTSRLFYLLASDETLWHRKLQDDFNFTGSETARNTGWKFLYKRLANPKVYVWGEKSHGRLGMIKFPQTHVLEGVPYPVHLKIPGARIISLVAGGMSFHALDSRGNIYVWGTLDGTNFALRSEGYSSPGKRAEQPMRLQLPVPFRNISCGRLHCTAIDASSQVWIFTSWGRPFRIASPLLDKSSPETTPLQIESGWSFSSVLTQSGDVLVYWPFDGRTQQVIATTNEELDQSPSPATRARVSATEPDVIPCHWWVMQDVEPTRLPAIPTGSLPQLLGTGLSQDLLGKETKLIKIAALDNTVIGLTNKGHVLKYSMLHGEDSPQHDAWEYLPHFCELGKIRAHPVFSPREPEDAQSRLEPLEIMLITHISAQFQTFVAYSTGSQSVVLLGKINDAPTPHAATPFIPTILPALQYRSVISVVLGDYHYGALTSTGKLLTWGAFSKGALGLGDPTKIEPGQPGGFENEQRLRAALNSQWAHTPPIVQVPTEVRFDYGERAREKYCFAAAASGWHMGALVIDLEVQSYCILRGS